MYLTFDLLLSTTLQMSPMFINRNGWSGVSPNQWIIGNILRLPLQSCSNDFVTIRTTRIAKASPCCPREPVFPSKNEGSYLLKCLLCTTVGFPWPQYAGLFHFSAYFKNSIPKTGSFHCCVVTV